MVQFLEGSYLALDDLSLNKQQNGAFLNSLGEPKFLLKFWLKCKHSSKELQFLHNF